MSDLISRDALKKALHNFFDGKVIDEPAYILRDVFYHIDSAQPVPLPDFKEGYKQAILDGKTNFSRPQGEWVYGEDECGQDGWFCSECGFFVPWYYQYYEKDIDFIRDYKVCPHCISEMITYTGKDRDTKGGVG